MNLEVLYSHLKAERSHNSAMQDANFGGYCRGQGECRWIIALSCWKAHLSLMVLKAFKTSHKSLLTQRFPIIDTRFNFPLYDNKLAENHILNHSKIFNIDVDQARSTLRFRGVIWIRCSYCSVLLSQPRVASWWNWLTERQQYGLGYLLGNAVYAIKQPRCGQMLIHSHGQRFIKTKSS